MKQVAASPLPLADIGAAEPAAAGPRGRIFLLSHMRAYTSLAGHILGSHARIDGYYEMHLSYEDASALARQREAFLADHAFKPGSRYLFDKLLHNDYRLLPERLGLADLKILIALARPEHTLKSIVHLFAQKAVADPYATPAGAADYYIARLAALADFSRGHRQGYCYYDAELWQRAPKRLLPRLSAWLELDTPLRETYGVFTHTGKAGRGDSSTRIHSGRIDRARSDYAHIAIPQPVLQAAQAAYLDCRRQLIAAAREAALL